MLWQEELKSTCRSWPFEGSRQKRATMPKIIVYTRDYCPYCRQAKALLQSKDVNFEEINMGDDEALQEKILSQSGRKTVPQIFVDGKPLGGYQELRDLDASGELDALLNPSK